MLRTVRVGHHTPPPEIHEGVPVQVFAGHWNGPIPATDSTVGDMAAQLVNYLPGAMVCVAVPTSEARHRCLDVLGVGLSDNNEEVNGGLVVEIECEMWDAGNVLLRVRDDAPVAAKE